MSNNLGNSYDFILLIFSTIKKCYAAHDFLPNSELDSVQEDQC